MLLRTAEAIDRADFGTAGTSAGSLTDLLNGADFNVTCLLQVQILPTSHFAAFACATVPFHLASCSSWAVGSLHWMQGALLAAYLSQFRLTRWLRTVRDPIGLTRNKQLAATLPSWSRTEHRSPSETSRIMANHASPTYRRWLLIAVPRPQSPGQRQTPLAHPARRFPDLPVWATA